MANKPLRVAWISDFPIEWIPDIPPVLRSLPRRHPATWAMVLLNVFERDPAIETHVFLLRKAIPGYVTFKRNNTVFHVLKASPMVRLATFFWLDTLLIKKRLRLIQPDLVHAWGSEKGASLMAGRLGYPYVMTIQGLFAWYKQVVEMPYYDLFVERIERIALRRASVVTTESAFSLGYLQRHYPKLQVLEAEHAPNPAFFQVNRQPQTNPFHFIVVGGLGHRKGTDMLVQALHRLSPEFDFKLTLVCGPNAEYVNSLRPLAPENFWQKVEFKHQLLPHEVADQLRTPTMLLMPTRADVSPNAVKEAVVAGVPVIAAESGGIPDYVQPGQNGLLFPPGNLEQFIETIRKGVQHPLFGKGQVDPVSLARSRDYLSPQRMAQNFLAAYKLALKA